MNKITKITMSILISSIIVFCPIMTFAHDAFFLQTLYDNNSYEIVGNVVEDRADLWGGEFKHIERELGNFSDIRNDYTEFFLIPTDESFWDEKKSEKGLVTTPMLYTFPSIKDSGFIFSNNNATGQDVERAFLIKDTLVPALNDAVNLVNGRKFKNMEEYLNKLSEIMKGGIVTSADGKRTFEIRYPFDTPSDPLLEVTDNDYVKITEITNGVRIVNTFVFRMPKGYTNPSSPMYRDAYKLDAKYITWQHLVYQASHSYFTKGYTSKDSSEVTKPSPLEREIVQLFSNMFNQLRNILGLYKNSDLVFNDGIRGSSAWSYGVMPKSWSNNVTVFHWLFQAIAWSLIALAIIKILIKRNIATINPSVKISMMDSIQDLLLTGFILANIFPIIQILLVMNGKIVNLFGAVSPDLSTLSEVNNYSNAIGGIIMQFFYLFINFYLNFTYILRGLTVAILMASSPLFVVALAFGGKWKILFSNFVKELVCNIFLQSFHAFILAFFLLTPLSSRGIEGLVLAFALIPLTEFFKTMVMGNSGNFVQNLGMKSIGTAVGMVGGTVLGASSSSRGGNKEQKGSSRESSSSVDSFGGRSERITRNNNPSSSREARSSTIESHNNRTIPLQETNSSLGNNDYDISKELETAKLRDDSSGFSENLNKIQGIESSGKDFAVSATKGALKVAKGALKTTATATKIAAGIGAGLALGSNPDIAKMSGGLIFSAGKDIGTGAKNTAKSISQNIGDAFHEAKQGSHNKKVESIYKSGGSMESELFSQELRNGDREVHRDSAVLAQEGLISSRIIGKNDRDEDCTEFIYDFNKLTPNDKQNLHEYAALWREADSPNLSDDAKDRRMAHLRREGVEYVGINKDGNIAITYNQIGLEKMGIKSSYSTKDGRTVERKRPTDPISTQKTFRMEKFVDQASNSDTQKNKDKN